MTGETLDLSNTCKLIFIWAPTKISKVLVSCLHSFDWFGCKLSYSLSWPETCQAAAESGLELRSSCLSLSSVGATVVFSVSFKTDHLRKGNRQRTSALESPNRSHEKEHKEEGWDPDVLPSQSLHQ